MLGENKDQKEHLVQNSKTIQDTMVSLFHHSSGDKSLDSLQPMHGVTMTPVIQDHPELTQFSTLPNHHLLSFHPQAPATDTHGQLNASLFSYENVSQLPVMFPQTHDGPVNLSNLVKADEFQTTTGLLVSNDEDFNKPYKASGSFRPVEHYSSNTLEAKVKDLEEKLEKTEIRLSKMTSTMEAQQKLVHDTIGHYMSIKSDYQAKELTFEEKLRDTEATVKAKDAAIKNLEDRLEETSKQLERLNALVSGQVLPTASAIMKEVSDAAVIGNHSMQSHLDGAASLVSSASLITKPSHVVTAKDRTPENIIASNASIQSAFQSISGFASQASPSLILSPSELAAAKAKAQQESSHTTIDLMHQNELLSLTKSVDSVALQTPQTLKRDAALFTDANTSGYLQFEHSSQLQAIMSLNNQSSPSSELPLNASPLSSSSSVPIFDVSSVSDMASVFQFTGMPHSLMQPSDCPLESVEGHRISEPVSSRTPAQQEKQSLSGPQERAENAQIHVQESVAIPSSFETGAQGTPPLKRQKSIRSRNLSLASKPIPPTVISADQGTAQMESDCNAVASRPWSAQEKKTLRKAVRDYGEQDESWIHIMAQLPTRSVEECKAQWLSVLKTRKGKWLNSEDRNLLQVFGQIYKEETESGIQPALTSISFWSKVSQHMEGRNAMQCMARYTETLDPSLKRGKWSLEEDSLLMTGVNKFGKSWVKVAECIPGRTQRQCRTRWMLLNPKETAEQSEIDLKPNSKDVGETQYESEVFTSMDRRVSKLSLEERRVEEFSDDNYDSSQDDDDW